MILLLHFLLIYTSIVIPLTSPYQIFQFMLTPMHRHKIQFHLFDDQYAGQTVSFTISAMLQSQTAYTTTLYSNSFNMGQQTIVKFTVWNFDQENLWYKLQFFWSIEKTSSEIQNILENFHLWIDTPHVEYDDEMFFFSTIFKRDNTNYILPFNLLSQKQLKAFVNIQSKGTLETTSYKHAPFLDTYWNQHGIDTVGISWMPYLSECNTTSKKIILADIIQPKNCYLNFLANVETFKCHGHSTVHKCLLQENYIQKTNKYEWYYNPSITLFYMYPQAVNKETAYTFYHNSQQSQNWIDLTYNLLAVRHNNGLSLTQKPKQIIITFNVYAENIHSLELMSSSVTTQPTVQDQYLSQELQENQAIIRFEVNYINYLQRFYYLRIPNLYYLLIPITICLSLVIKKIFQKHLKINLNLLQRTTILYIPIIKGMLYFTIVNISFYYLMYTISSSTNFNLISNSYSSQQQSQLSQEQKSGRNGICLLFSGIYMLNKFINVGFKIGSDNQLRIKVEDDLCQKYPTEDRDTIIEKNHKFINQKCIFIKQNLSGRKKQILLGYLVAIISFHFTTAFITKLSVSTVAILQVIVLAPTGKILYATYRKYFLKELYDLFPLFIQIETSLVYYLFISNDIQDLMILYLTQIFGLRFAHFLFDLLLEEYAIKAYYKDNKNWLQTKICQLFAEQIQIIIHQTYLERCIYYCSLISSKAASKLLRPFFILLVFYTFHENSVFQDLQIDKTRYLNIFICISVMIAIDYMMTFITIEIIQRIFHLKIIDTYSFEHFRFSRRKIRWMNENFIQDNGLSEYYRELQKFNFSSQLYYFAISKAFAMCVIFFGLRIIVINDYIFFQDPALFIIIGTVWIMGQFLSFILEIIVWKLKLYEKQDTNKMRTQLDSIQQILKKDTLKPYLGLDYVRSFFMYKQKQWIIENLRKILTVSQISESQFTKTYNFYRSSLRQNKLKMKIQSQKRRLQQEELKQTHKKKPQPSKVIKLNRQTVQIFQPILKRWLYTSRQNNLLKNIIADLKIPKQACEQCSLQLDLQVVEQQSFYQIVNEYRVLNVGLLLNPEGFHAFYQSKQKFITLCLECKRKKMYMSSSSLKHVPIGKKMILKWLFGSRSKSLHKKAKNDSKVSPQISDDYKQNSIEILAQEDSQSQIQKIWSQQQNH